MQVVAAAVHDSIVDRGEWQSRVFLNGKTVDVGAQCDARSGLFSADQPDHTRFERIVQDFNVVRSEQLLNVGACFEFLEAALRMGVQVMADFDEFRRDFDMFSHLA